MSQHDRLLDQIRRLALQGMGERRTDGQLLERFISARDEAAFALLLRRHGAMVWSVCRRILGNAHDADDAFQAAFLVLVRKADTIRPREAVGNWLYGVAYRTALEARRRIARRRAKEQSLQDVPPLESKSEELWSELWPVLDRELSRLADKYRLPIVLCDLEGRSRKEVARQLAIPEGTLSSRLATARKKLAARLARLGFTLSGVTLAALLTENTAAAALAPTLATTTTKAAMLVAAGPMAVAGVVSATVGTLTEGVLKTMFLAKIKTATLVLCSVAALGLGTGGVYYQTRAGAAAPANKRPDRERPNRDRKAAQEIEKWRRIAEEAQARERELRAELERVRREAKEQRERAEAERARAEEERIARERTVLEFEAAHRQQGLPKNAYFHVGGHKFEAAHRQQGLPNEALEKVERARKQVMAEFQERQEALHLQQRKLEAEQNELGADLRRKIADLDDLKARIVQKHVAHPPKRRKEPPRGEGDKLDQILERLERLEKRLDRLEKGRK